MCNIVPDASMKSATAHVESRQTHDRQKKEPLEIPMNSEGFQLVRLAKYPREDLNGLTEPSVLSRTCESAPTTGGAESGALDARSSALQALIAVWDTLDDATINRIMRLIQG